MDAIPHPVVDVQRGGPLNDRDLLAGLQTAQSCCRVAYASAGDLGSMERALQHVIAAWPKLRALQRRLARDRGLLEMQAQGDGRDLADAARADLELIDALEQALGVEG